MRGWRLPLRLAWRDALRSRARSALVLVMIALPVLGVTAATVLIATSNVSTVEGLDRELGDADALVAVREGVDEVAQAPNPDDGLDYDEDSGTALTPAQLAAALGDRPLTEVRQGWGMLRTDRGATDAQLTEVDLSDPLAARLVDLTDGRLPRAAGEVVVNQALADKGYDVGDPLRLRGQDSPESVVVGIAESSRVRSEPAVAGLVGSLGFETFDTSRTWLVGGGPMDWDEVLALNERGVSAYSRTVLEDPPPASEVPSEVEVYESSTDETALAIAALVVTMALLEVVLLAGPSFAVGARRQARTLALVAASGGTPAQARRVVLASAIVLGAVASVGGVLLGIALAAALLPLVQSFTSSWLGPFQVAWLPLIGVAGFGLVSAFLAAVVPAHLASRQDIVAVLGGRRGDRKPSLRSPLLGVVLLGVGIVGAVLGARPGGELLIAAAAIPAVLGMVLLVPVVLAVLGRLAGRLPLSLRFAVRDAARHRTRTVPAVAAVAATVTGVVALGISTSSDAAEARATYAPMLPAGAAIVSTLGGQDAEQVRTAIGREVPGAEPTDIRGVRDATEEQYLEVTVTAGSDDWLLSSSSSVLGSSLLVGDELPPLLLGVDEDERTSAARVLAAGGAVAFTDRGVRGDEVGVRVARSDGMTGEPIGRPVSATLPAVVIDVDPASTGPVAVLAPAAARQMDLEVTTVAVAITGARVTEEQEQAVTEVLAATASGQEMYVERGYRADGETLIIQLVLAGLGALLMLGGTLTATFLALSDARPDLATLSAVGASPRTRRGVAASYALVVGFVGAVLGAAVGFVPGMAVSRPLTTMGGETCVITGSGSCTPSGVQVGPFLDVPWLLILGIVVVLPLLTAAVVGLTARSRLPLVARLS
ncbi:ABC transporter permease [Nocardioides lianchengensis]|uniref:Putative ABC transport system permease protein n=1 Tax=Nocardioides lianchengensis TaxID=1045774 RepID=A0A1G6L4U5_9ACTN|nr:ABC transporter permease [Nocardioides lianchengensis]NYG12700.1 putative ABC transport system permease protein [Nocardioides lianchengensis]SDC37716.1 putative ABC transport system permease protein [Nocardioides lianchengensis]